MNWKNVFNEGSCPECGWTITITPAGFSVGTQVKDDGANKREFRSTKPCIDCDIKLEKMAGSYNNV